MDKDTFGKLVSRVRGHVREHKSTYKDSGMALGGGALASVIHTKVVPSIDFMKSNAWAEPALLAVSGHFLSRKHKALGHGMLGVSGYQLADWFMAEQDKKTATAAPGTEKALRQNTTGFEEAGEWERAGGREAAALIDSAFTALPGGDSGAYMDASGIRDSDATSDVARTRSEAGVLMNDSSYYGGDASDALDL